MTATLAGISAPHAFANPAGSPQAQAASLQTKIQTLGLQEDALAQKYDQANLVLQAAHERVAQATLQWQLANAAEAQERSLLVQDAVSTYETDGQPTGSLLSRANTAVVKNQYEGTLASAAHEKLDRYRNLSVQASAARTNLEKDQASAQSALNAVSKARESTATKADELLHLYGQVQGQMATLISEQQAAQQTAQQQAAQQRVAAAKATATAAPVAPTTTPSAASPTPAATPKTGSAARTVLSSPTTAKVSAGAASSAPAAPVPQGSGVSGAIAAAESQVGVPYAWGGATPGQGFDCSGLVMWAFAKVGIALPHSSSAQYGDTTHIPMSALQPGDLVFFGDLSHVAIYLGNGQIIEAPYSGVDVRITAMYNQFVLAGRVT